MEKKFLDIYNELGDERIEELYVFSCLKASGFNDELGQKLIPLLKDLWLIIIHMLKLMNYLH